MKDLINIRRNNFQKRLLHQHHQKTAYWLKTLIKLLVYLINSNNRRFLKKRNLINSSFIHYQDILRRIITKHHSFLTAKILTPITITVNLIQILNFMKRKVLPNKHSKEHKIITCTMRKAIRSKKICRRSNFVFERSKINTRMQNSTGMEFVNTNLKTQINKAVILTRITKDTKHNKRD